MPRFLLICFLLPVMFCKEKPQKIAGVHDTPQTAVDLAHDRVVQGSFVRGNSTQYFKVRLSEAGMMRAELSAARGADSSISVFYPPETLLTTVDDNGTSLAEEIPPVYVGAGEVLIRIQARSDEQAEFNFFYRTFKAPSDVEREPNNSPQTANVLAGMHATGFHGPVFMANEKEKLRERDCFSKMITATESTLVSAKLSGVDGVTGALAFLDSAGNEIHRQEATEAGAALETSPVLVQPGAQLIICVSAARPIRATSRDYYDLNLVFADLSLKSEIEPNNSPQTASRMTADAIAGQVASLTDIDYLSYTNKKEYPVLVNISLESAQITTLRLSIARKGEAEQIFEDSAVRQEVAENVRLETGEQLTLGVRVRPKVKKKDFKPAVYTIKINESQFNDDSETENNDTPARADVLIDHGQKWGFLNPLADVDFYRLQLDAPVQRQLVFESKIACKVRLEHLRGAKTLASSSVSGDQRDSGRIGLVAGQSNLKYAAIFEKDDLIKLQCIGQKPNPADRAYRLALVEP